MIKNQEMPHDLLAEKAFLGCLLIDGESFNEIIDLEINKEDFFHPQYRQIFEAIKDLAINSRPVDYVTVCSKLADMGKLESLGEDDNRGQSFILNIAEEQATSANVHHYAKTVKDKATLRNIIKMALQVAKEGQNFSGNIKEFISFVETSFFKVTQLSRSEKTKKLSDCLLDNLKDLSDSDRKPGEISGIPTGLDSLDKKLLGMQAGQLIIGAARPGMGKSSLALCIALNASKHSGFPVAIFSLEMLASELSMRALSVEAKVDSKKLKMKNFSQKELKELGLAIERLSSHQVFINDDSNASVLDILSECRKIKTENGLGLVVVDYVQLMKPQAGGIPREQQISEISRGLKSLAKELECPVMALSQLNRAVESRTDKRPLVSDLRESGSLEQDADIVLLIYRDEYHYPDTSTEKGIAEIIVGKNRSGETGTVKLAWMGTYTAFAELAHEMPQ